MKENNLRKERSIFNSGKVNLKNIPVLKKRNYIIVPKPLDGDAPKAFLKIYFYNKGGAIRRKNIKTWESYIVKSAEKWYPIESIIEYLINRIGYILGLRINETYLFQINGQIRFLSKYFLSNQEVMSHGAEIFGEYLNDMDLAREIAEDKKISREIFTFEFLTRCIRFKYPENHDMILKDIIRMLVFDAIVGNNDRHFYNWAVISSIKRGDELPKLSPIYDSSRGLSWNWSETQVKKYLINEKLNGKKIANYIINASPRISIESNNSINHFDLILFIRNFDNGAYNSIVEELCDIENEILVIQLLHKEFSSILSEERIFLIELILKNRFKILRKEVV